MDGESAQKRQQSALELLLTYSWAFIIIAVFIAVVFLLAGSKPPAQYLPSQCNIQPLLPCVQTLITTPGTTTKASYKLLLINNLGPAINFTKNGFSINTTGVGALGNSQYIGNCTPSLLLEGSEALCNVYMTGNYFPAVGSQTSVEFTIGYQICNGQTQSSCPSTVYKSSGYSIQSMSSPSSNLYKLTFATSSEGTIVLNGHSYSGGTSVLLPQGKYSVYANPSAGYAFTSWSTTSGVTVVSSTSQSTNATLSANSTLTASFIYVGASTSTTSTATTSTSTTVTTTTATTSTSTTVTSTTSTSSTSTTSTTSSTTTTILNGVLYYVPVTITNGRSAATPSTFQERIAVPSSTYSSY